MWSEMSNTKEQDNLTVVTQPLPNDELRDSQRALLVSLSMYIFPYCLREFPYLN